MRSDGDPLPKAESVRADVLALLREKRYEEALSLLYRARSQAPNDRELQKSIDQIKEFLIGAYAKRLGGLDQIAAPLPPASVRSPDAVLVARYIDGAATLGDLAQMCPLGRLRTLQVLLGLYGGAEPRRVDLEPPSSGLRVPQVAAALAPTRAAAPVDAEPAPETARSASISTVMNAVAQPAESAESHAYSQRFAQGTAAFVQRRFAEAVAAFEECVRLRPDDRGAEVMLRRSRRDLESQ